MKYNKFTIICSTLLITSIIFLLVTISYYYYKVYKENRPESDVITKTGQINDININEKTLSINLGQNIEKLIINYQTKMILPPEANQLNIDLTKLKINDNVSVKFNASSKILELLVKLESENSTNQIIKGKITSINNSNLELKTLETNFDTLSYDIKSSNSIEVIDKTSDQDKKIIYSKLAKNDDIIIEINSNNSISKISLIKIGPK